MSRPKTVTEKQLVANRRNAGRSTGPRTPEGKARSRWNALKHGALSRAVVPPPLAAHERVGDFHRLHETLRQDFAPGSALEEVLIESIATCYWRLARVYRAEAGAVAFRQSGAEAAASQRASKQPSPTKLSPVEIGIQTFGAILNNPLVSRRLLSGEDPKWDSAGDEEVLAAIEGRVARLKEQFELTKAEDLEAERLGRSIPSIDYALHLARYEAHIQRQLYRALAALEHLRAARLDLPGPPDLDLPNALLEQRTVSDEPLPGP